MSQSSLDFNQFRTAYEMSKSGDGKILEDNFLLELIQTFAQEKRVLAFKSDLRIETDNFDSTLNDAGKLLECEKELALLIIGLSELQSGMAAKRLEIIEEHVQAGNLQEGLFRIVPIVKKENRKVNIVKIKEQYPSQFDILLKLKIDDIEQNYVPTIKEVETIFKTKANDVLIPAGEKIVGYDLQTLQPEKAAEVEV